MSSDETEREGRKGDMAEVGMGGAGRSHGRGREA